MSDIHEPLIIEEFGDVTEARFADCLIVDEFEMTAAREQLFRRFPGDSSGYFVLNLAGVTFLSSGALGILISIQQRLSKGGGKLRLRNVQQNIVEVLVATKLDRLFGVG